MLYKWTNFLHHLRQRMDFLTFYINLCVKLLSISSTDSHYMTELIFYKTHFTIYIEIILGRLTKKNLRVNDKEHPNTYINIHI